MQRLAHFTAFGVIAAIVVISLNSAGAQSAPLILATSKATAYAQDRVIVKYKTAQRVAVIYGRSSATAGW